METKLRDKQCGEKTQENQKINLEDVITENKTKNIKLRKESHLKNKISKISLAEEKINLQIERDYPAIVGQVET